MSQDDDYALLQRRKKVLDADRWRCILCDIEIDPGDNAIGNEEEKDSVLRSHLNDKHLNSPMMNTGIQEKYQVCYFKPIVETLTDNLPSPQ
jgi:hypothetical protein